jgi:hypothetical protein
LTGPAPSGMTCAVYDGSGTEGLPRLLRLALNREHLHRADGDDADLHDPVATFTAFAKSAQELDRWHAEGCQGPRPAGGLRPYRPTRVPRWHRLPARLVYQLVCDPDGRPTKLRLRHRF